MAFLSIIRRWHKREQVPIREISRRLGVSRNTIRKYLRSELIEPKFQIPNRPSKLDPYAEKLSAWLRREENRSRVDELAQQGAPARGTTYRPRNFVGEISGRCHNSEASSTSLVMLAQGETQGRAHVVSCHCRRIAAHRLAGFQLDCSGCSPPVDFGND